MSRTAAGPHDIHMGSLWSNVRFALPLLAGAALIAGVGTFAVSSLIAKRYDAEAQLTITAKPTNPYSAGKNDAGAAATVTPRLDPAAINTHVRALMAPDLLLKVATTLGLASRAEFNPAQGPVDTLDAIRRLAGLGPSLRDETIDSRLLTAMKANLSVSAARESRFITIRFRSTDQQVAADVANAIATTYRQSLREIPVRETNEAVAALVPKIEQLSREVFEAEAVAKRYRAETDQLTGGAQSMTLQQQRLQGLNGDLVKAEADLAKSESRLSAARELSVGGGTDTLPEVQNSRIIQDLIAQRVRLERQVNEARAVLLPAHPRMRQLNADLVGLRRSIRGEIAIIVNSIAKEVRLGQLRTDRLRKEIAELKTTAVARSGDEARLRSLEATATSKRNELERLQKQLEDNRTVVDTNRVPIEATVVSEARAQSDAVFPKRGPFSLLAMAATLLLGLVFVIARGLMSQGAPQRRPDRKRSEAGATADGRAAPALTGPLAARDRGRGRTLPSSAEAPGPMADLAGRFIARQIVGSGYRVLLAGAASGIDPSDGAMDLAVELSERGARVLLVDWSLNGRRLLGDVEVGSTASLAELMEERAQFEDVLVALADSNIQYAYACVARAGDAFEDEARVNLLFDAFDEVYDQVIVLARYDDARALFELIEGRFDVGVAIGDRAPVRAGPNGELFLGFEVADIDIIHHVGGPAGPAARRSKQSDASAQ